MPYMHSLALAIISWTPPPIIVIIFVNCIYTTANIFSWFLLASPILSGKYAKSFPNANTIVSEESRRTYDLGPCICS